MNIQKNISYIDSCVLKKLLLVKVQNFKIDVIIGRYRKDLKEFKKLEVKDPNTIKLGHRIFPIIKIITLI